jgi:hypothetical protein
MPVYSYRCSDGHQVDRVLAMRDPHPRTVRCFCGKRARRDYRFTLRPEVLPHFNRSLDRMIHDRGDLERAQKKSGFSDVDPSLNRGPSRSWE